MNQTEPPISRTASFVRLRRNEGIRRGVSFSAAANRRPSTISNQAASRVRGRDSIHASISSERHLVARGDEPDTGGGSSAVRELHPRMRAWPRAQDTPRAHSGGLPAQAGEGRPAARPRSTSGPWVYRHTGRNAPGRRTPDFPPARLSRPRMVMGHGHAPDPRARRGDHRNSARSMRRRRGETKDAAPAADARTLARTRHRGAGAARDHRRRTRRPPDRGHTRNRQAPVATELQKRRERREAQAWLALAATQAERTTREMHTAIETGAWDIADTAYEQLCETLVLATHDDTTHAAREPGMWTHLDDARDAVHHARACGWWPRSHPAIAAHEDAESNGTTSGFAATLLQKLANDETRYRDIATCAERAAGQLGPATISVHPQNTEAPGPNDGGKVLIVVATTPSGRGLSVVERETIDAHTRAELAGYGVHKAHIEVTNRPLANTRWYRVECEQTRTERCEATVLASNAHEARRAPHSRQRNHRATDPPSSRSLIRPDATRRSPSTRTSIELSRPHPAQRTATHPPASIQSPTERSVTTRPAAFSNTEMSLNAGRGEEVNRGGVRGVECRTRGCIEEG